MLFDVAGKNWSRTGELRSGAVACKREKYANHANCAICLAKAVAVQARVEVPVAISRIMANHEE